MGGREPDERPPIEILGADPGVSSTEHVALGPRRPGRPKGWLLAVGALVLAALVASVALGGTDDDEPERAADDEPRDNADHVELGGRQTTSSTRPTTTTTLPLGPVFGEPVDGVLLMYRPGQIWSRVDLTTGVLDEIDLPVADGFSSIAMPGGVVIPSPDREVRYYPVLDGSTEPEGVILGSGDQAVRAGADRVWLLEQPRDREDPNTHARLVDLQGHVIRELEVPGYQSVVTPEEMVVSRGGRVYAFDESGYRPIATGWVNGAIGDDALITACDDEGGCSLRVQPTDGGASRLLVRLDDPDDVYYDAPSVALDGRVALVRHTSRVFGQRLQLFDRSGEQLADVDVSGGEAATPQWLPDDLGLLLNTSLGVKWVKHDGRAWIVDDFPIDSVRTAQAFFVVTP